MKSNRTAGIKKGATKLRSYKISQRVEVNEFPLVIGLARGFFGSSASALCVRTASETPG